MSGLFTVDSPSIMDPTQQSAGATSNSAARIAAAAKGLESESAFQMAAQQMVSHQEQIDAITKLLREPLPHPATYGVTDPSGVLIAWIGYQVSGNVAYYGGWFKQLYIGGTSPADAKIVADSNGNVTITGATLTLTANGVTTTLNNANGFVASTVESIKSHDDVSGGYSYLSPHNLIILSNDEAHALANLTVPGSGGSQAGLLSLINQAGTSQGSLTPSRLTLLSSAGGPVLLDAGSGLQGSDTSGTYNFNAANGLSIVVGSVTLTSDVSNGFKIVASGTAQNAAVTRFAQLSSGGNASGTDVSGAWLVNGSGLTIQGSQVVSTRVVAVPVTLADVIAVLQHHGLSN